MTNAEPIVALASLVEPDFSPLRDDDCVIGFHHTRNYHVGGCDCDGFVSVSTTHWSWGDAISRAKELRARGSDHVLIRAIESTGNGYFQPEYRCHFSARAV